MMAVAGRHVVRAQHGMRVLLQGPQAMAFLPALCLGAFWIAGEIGLTFAAFGVPVMLMMTTRALPAAPIAPDAVPPGGLVSIANAAQRVEAATARAVSEGQDTACLLVHVDGIERVAAQAGETTAETLRDQSLARLRAVLRNEDAVLRIGDARYAVLLDPMRRFDLETLMQLATRLQSAAEEPAWIDGALRYLTACIGFSSLGRLRNAERENKLFSAAQIALDDARAQGPSAIRAWTPPMSEAFHARRSLVHEVRGALADGQIRPWFQPQVCTSTGRVSGIEALARWVHPDRGIVAPADFLVCLEETGQMQSLGEVILRRSLAALRDWDRAGLDIPRVSVNFSAPELQAPGFPERVTWELDRYGLKPSRLGIEILETVLSDAPDPTLARNIRRLSDLGCFIELDDFGTGHASLSALASLNVDRIKIDRSYVTRADRDPGQQRMVSALLGFAEHLGIQALAEGVESAGEHVLLSQLGCSQVQGFGVARPMPASQVSAWVRSHTDRIARPPTLGRGQT